MTGKLGHYTAVLALLVVAIVAIAVGLLAYVLDSSADRLDKQQLATQTLIVKSVVRRQLAKLESNVTDYALWDDMYDRFAGKPDPQWDIENLGPFAAPTFQLEHVAVLSADGTLVYDYDRGSAPMDGKDRARLARLTVPLIDRARRGDMRAITGVFEFAGQAHYLAAHPIWVGSEKREAGNERPNFALVYLKALDRAYLAGAAGDFDLRGLHVDRSAPMVMLDAPAGEPAMFGLSWQPSQGGRQFVADSTRLLLAAAPIVALLLIGLAFGWAGIVNQARDSEVRSTEARAKAAEDTSRAKSLFIASMSHEFRTPLNAINGFAECLKGDVLALGMPEKYKEYAADIQASGQHLLRIVNNLLLFSKIEANQHEARLEAVSLGEETTSAMRMLNILAQQRGVRLATAEVPAKLLVLADPQSLAQIIVNVVGNALKFSPRDSEVRIELAVLRELGACDLRVVDQGCGIPEKTLLQLGQPFVQADGVYTRREQGTGLGLAICLKLAAQMGARLLIDSVEGQGTTVTLRLPLADPSAIEPASPERLAVAAA